MKIGEQIKRLINEKGVKPVFIAEKINVPQQTLMAMLNGSRKISVVEFYGICTVLGVTPDYFYASKKDTA